MQSRLIQLWMESTGGTQGLEAQAAALFAQAAPEVRAELAEESQALHLLHLARWHGEDSDPAQRDGVVARCQALRRTASEPAGLLALAAIFAARRSESGFQPPEADVQLLERTAERADLSDLARYWCCTALSAWLVNQQQYDRALVVALRARSIGQGTTDPAADPLLLATRMNALFSLVLLCAGATHDAIGLINEQLAADERRGVRHFALQYNLLLALMIEGRVAESVALLQSPAWLEGDAQLKQGPNLAAMQAWVLSANGQLEEAAELLTQAGDPQRDDINMTGCNLAWMRAETWLRLGRSREAHDSLQAYLPRLAQAKLPPTPLNGTQLYRVLSLACEAEGDMAGALQALRQSQAMCMRWVADEVRSRLRLMTDVQSNAETAARLAQRCEAVRRVAAQSIAQQQDEGTQVDRLRQQLAMVAHELRNPLVGVVGATSLAMLGQMDARQRRYLRIANSSAQVLSALCTNLLDLARIEAGQFHVRPKRFALRPMVDKTLAIFQPMAELKPLTLRLDWGPTVPATVFLDSLRLQQVLMNLLGNAMKFTRQGSVTLRVAATTSGLRMAILDTGPGLEPAALARVFDEFYTSADGADGAESADDGVAGQPPLMGSGVGLALCRQLVTLMGGRIGVDSTPGAGSEFWLELPLPMAKPKPT